MKPNSNSLPALADIEREVVAESREWGRQRLEERLQKLAEEHGEVFPPKATSKQKAHPAKRVRRRNAARCLGRAQKILYLGDGAEWVWNLKKDRWNSAVELLDFYHGSEHFWSLGRALHGEIQPQLSQWVQPLRHQLRHGREQRVLRHIAQLKKRRGEAGKVLRREKNNFETHASRLNYQAIAKRGWPIGSGAVESACRQKQCRFKRCGQFWSKQGLRNLCALDEARRNHPWDQLWSPN